MKQLIILSCTIPFGTQSEVKVRTRVSEFNEILKQSFPQELQDETNTIIRWIVVPIAASDTNSRAKIECIYPVAGYNGDLLEKLNLLDEKTKRIKI